MSTSQLDPRSPSVQQKPDPLPQTEDRPTLIAPRTAVMGGLLWMVAGPMTLFMSTIGLVFSADRFWTVVDGFFAAGLAAMFVGRWLEFRCGAAETAEGKPASARDMVRFYALLGFSGLAVWLIASLVRTVWLLH